MTMELGLPKSRMPEGFDEDDFSFSKLYKCIHEGGQKTMSDVLRAMYALPPGNSGDGTMFLRDYLKNVLGWNSGKIKAKIYKTEQCYLDADLMTVEFDISFACKVMTEVLSDIYNELSDDCRDQINFLKKLRNSVNHKYGCKELDVTSEINNLKVVLGDIYKGVGTYLKKDFTDNISVMEKRFDDIRDAHIRQIDIKSYEDDVKMFKGDAIHRLISGGRQELMKMYRKLEVLNPCSWMVDEEVEKSSVNKFHVDKIFTPLRTEDSCSQIEIKNLLTVTKQMSGEQKLPSALLLHGLAGCGKTSLCHYLLYDWCSKEGAVSSLSNVNLLLFVSVRSVRSCSLNDYLRQQLIPDTTKDFAPDHIIPFMKELDILFIIDGFDEANQMSNALVEDIFAKFGRDRIILTTRHEFLQDAVFVSRKHLVDYLSIEICGFDDKGLEEFTVKVFRAIEKHPVKLRYQTDNFLRYIRGPGKILDSHLKLPLTLALLIYLWRDEPEILNQITTCTCLYFELFNLCQKKLMKRLNCRNLDSRIIEELLLFLGKQAWHMLQSGNIDINDEIKKKIEDECIRKGIDEIQFMSAFLMCEFKNREEEKSFSFLHKTQMEYLAAECLAYDVRKEKNLGYIIREVKEWRRYHEVIIFLTGHLAKEKILKYHVKDLFTLLDKAEVDILNYNVWWKFFVESFKLPQLGETIVKEKLPREDWQLNHTHLVAGLNLLIYTEVELKTLKIDLASSVEPYKIPEFLETMKKIGPRIKKRHHKRKPILVELHFWRHNEYDFDKPSDEFILTLNPWGHLMNFTGGLGEQEAGKEVFAFCFKLKTIRARVMTPGALRSLSNSLTKIHKSVRQLRITLALTPNCAPESLARLTFRGNLEITMEGIRDVDKEWFVAIIQQVSGEGRCQHICLPHSEVTPSVIVWFVKTLKRNFQGKFSIETINYPNDEEIAKLEKMEKETHIAINWI